MNQQSVTDAATVEANKRLAVRWLELVSAGEVDELCRMPDASWTMVGGRYDVPMTAHTTGGHRRYTKLAIDELRLMRDEIARGKRAADAAVSARLLLQLADAARPSSTPSSPRRRPCNRHGSE